MSPLPKPDLEQVHTNVEFGLRFRLELDKTLLTLGAALFAFTVAFVPTVSEEARAAFPKIKIAWIALALSMIGGIVELFGWEKFYLSFRDHDWKGEDGRPARRAITTWRRIARFVFFVGFAVGAVMIGLFAIDALPTVRTPPK